MTTRTPRSRPPLMAALLALAIAMPAGAGVKPSSPLVASFGGSDFDQVLAVAIDTAGNIYLAGDTLSLDVPMLNALFPAPAGDFDGFVAKFNPAGTTLLFSTYFGGSGADHVLGLAVDANQNIYLVGSTNSPNLPVTMGARDVICGTDGECNGGLADAFVTKIHHNGYLAYSGYLGGSGADYAYAVAVDANLRAVVARATSSFDFPVVKGVQQAHLGGGYDGFVSRFSFNGGALSYSSYYGGSGADLAYGVAVDALGDAYLTGVTDSPDLRAVSAQQSQLAGATDAFMARIAVTGDKLLHSTYFGGSGPDVGLGVAVISAGRTLVSGTTWSANFPVYRAVQAAPGGGSDAFLVALDAAARTGLAYATYYGGSADEEGSGIAALGGNAVLAGWTMSSNLPVSVNAPQALFAGGGKDSFVAQIQDGVVPTIKFASYIGGQESEAASGVVVDRNGTIAVAGSLEIQSGPESPTSHGGDGFVVKLVGSGF